MSSTSHLNAEALSENDDKTSLGFWIYLMTDCVLFASLFATFAVLRNSTAFGPTGDELFELPFVLLETLILLTSSFTAGLAVIAYKYKRRAQLLTWLVATFVLGLSFLSLELYEFGKLYSEGHYWQTSAFLSSYFTLVGTHGFHIFVGLIWLTFILLQIFKRGLTGSLGKRIMLFSLFWHFLDIVWIFIFTFVYLMKGVSL